MAVGLSLQLLLALFLGEKVGFLMVGHLLSAVLIFPGATVVNFVGERFFPERTWTGDPRRPRLAGGLSIPITWGLVSLSAALELGPGSFLKQQMGTIEAWIVHIAGLIMVGSTMALVAGWALRPKPPVKMKILQPPVKLPGRK